MQTSRNTPMKLVLITNGTSTKFETETINRLFREGLDELHIRKPSLEKKDQIKFIDNIDSDFHSRLVLHDCYSLVHMYNINKIHVSRDWGNGIMSDFILNRMILRGKKVTKSVCVSSCADLYRQVRGQDEVMLGPVFSKSMYMINNQTIKTEDMARAIRNSKIPVLGVGGVSLENIDVFKQAGFSGLVLQKSVWKNADPVRAFIQLRDKVHEVKEQPLRIAI
jgi:thiamine-phosphate pyrophosphorylase